MSLARLHIHVHVHVLVHVCICAVQEISYNKIIIVSPLSLRYIISLPSREVFHIHNTTTYVYRSVLRGSSDMGKPPFVARARDEVIYPFPTKNALPSFLLAQNQGFLGAN